MTDIWLIINHSLDLKIIFAKIIEVLVISVIFILGLDFMENLLYKLSLMVGAKSGQEMLVRLIIAGVILVLFVLFNTKISKALSHIVCKILFSKSEKAQKAIKDSLVKPLSYFVSISGFYTALEIALPKLSENDGKIQTILLLLVKISFIVLTAWFGVNFINSDYSIQDKLDSSVKQMTVDRCPHDRANEDGRNGQ